jgi:hypothetical protein
MQGKGARREGFLHCKLMMLGSGACPSAQLFVTTKDASCMAAAAGRVAAADVDKGWGLLHGFGRGMLCLAGTAAAAAAGVA